MVRKTFTAQGTIAGKLCDITFAPAGEIVKGDNGVATDRMAIVIVPCRFGPPDGKAAVDREHQEPFTAADAEHILQALEAMTPLQKPEPEQAPLSDRRHDREGCVG